MKLLRKALLFLCSVLVMALSISPASATVVAKKKFQDLVSEADLVAAAEVVRVESHPTLDRRFAYTYVTLGGLEIIKGAYPAGELTLRMEGGPVGNGLVLHVMGIPAFREKERVVVFVKDNGESICPLVGWWQGLLRVKRDPGTGESVICSSDGSLITGLGNGDFVVRETASRRAGSVPPLLDGAVGELKSIPPPPDLSNGLRLSELKRLIRLALPDAASMASRRVVVKSAAIQLTAPAYLAVPGVKEGRR